MADPTQAFHMVGLSHHATPLHVREKIALTNEQVRLLYSALKKQEGIHEVAVLRTCNRMEVYAFGHPQIITASVAHWIAEFSEYPLESLRQLLHDRSGHEAVTHLFKVSSGLDSQIIGETEVFGQVKDAYDQAIAEKTAGPVLHRTFQKAFQAAKWVRTNTRISQGQVSIGNVAVDLALRIFGELTHSRILVVGSGEVGQGVLKSLKGRGAKAITVSSRTAERAQSLAATYDAEMLRFHEWPGKLSQFDIAVFSTAAPNAILQAEMVDAAMQSRPSRPLFLIDVALPRDIDAAVADISNVFVYNLDDLSAIANENLAHRMADADTGTRYIEERARSLWEKLHDRT
ncbi:MAG: glutamyl-tRNA reductase [Verrucomicrobiota bacterium]|nr:glutamyl-tRNA reductase [Verrucomicrobiota bacterium]